MQLRDYQNTAITKIKESFQKGMFHVILQAPTGSGKTVIFSELTKLTASNSNKVLILTNRAELLQQAGGSIKRAGVNAFYIQAGCNVVSNNFNAYVAMSQTLRRRIDLEYWKKFISSISLVIIDEMHLQEFNYLFESGLLDKKHVIGFTATPKRSGKMRQLGLDYEDIIPTISVMDLIKSGYLVNDDYYGMEAPDMAGVQIDHMKGDYKENQMFQKYNTAKLYAGVVTNYKEITPDTKAICFCVNIEHCVKTAIEFNKNGITAKFIVSGISPPKEVIDDDMGKMARYEERKRVYDLYKEYFDLLSGDRAQIFEDFKNNKFQVLINAGIATTGYDCPDCETIILNRATNSLTLLLQMVGRGSRIFPSKTHFNILDFGDNCKRLGYYTEDRFWSLWHEQTTGKGLPPVKQCGFNADGNQIGDKSGCKRLILAAYTICPFCGFKYPEKTHKEVDLTGIVFDFENKTVQKIKRIKDMTNKELHEYWKAKKHKTYWLFRQLWYKGREDAIEQFGKVFGWTSKTVKKGIDFCKGLN